MTVDRQMTVVVGKSTKLRREQLARTGISSHHVNQHSRRLLRRDSDSDSLDSYNRFRNEARDSLANDIGKKDAVPGSKVASHITGHRVHMDDSDSNLERMSGV